MKRIIKSSSNPGDVILDPFCGCGTTVEAAQSLEREWIGIDITYVAIARIKGRLSDSFEDQIDYELHGEPVSVPDAHELFNADPYQFQWWILDRVHARAIENRKRGADKGIDGRLYFHDDRSSGETKQIIFSVKGGGTGVAHVRDLRGVIEREKASIGILITLEQPTRDMLQVAAAAGFYTSPIWEKDFPRIQVVTVEQILRGTGIEMPPIGQVNKTFEKGRKAPGKTAKIDELEF